MAAPASDRQPVTVAEVREIIAALIVEKNQLQHANDPAAAEAIGLAIEYWRAVLARMPDDRQQRPRPEPGTTA